MGAFEHVMTLVSFVLALQITHLLITVVEIVRAGERVRLSWIHAGWMAVGLMNAVGWWIGLWDYHGIAEWPIGSVFYNLTAVLVGFLSVAFMCPKVPEEKPLDLWEFHLAHRKQYIGLVMVSTMLAVGEEFYYGNVYGVAAQNLQAFISLAFLPFELAGFLSPNIWVQRVSVVVALLGSVAFFVFGEPVLK